MADAAIERLPSRDPCAPHPRTVNPLLYTLREGLRAPRALSGRVLGPATGGLS